MKNWKRNQNRPISKQCRGQSRKITNETIVNETITNETIVNETITNETIVNETITGYL